MANDRDDVVWLHSRNEVSLVDLAESCGLSEADIRELVEYGVLEPRDAEHLTFAADCLARLRAAARVCHDLELEPATLAVVLSFLDRIEALEAQIRGLAARLPPER